MIRAVRCEYCGGQNPGCFHCYGTGRVPVIYRQPLTPAQRLVAFLIGFFGLTVLVVISFLLLSIWDA